MPRLDDILASRLAAIREQGLFRALRRVDSPQAPRLGLDGRDYLNFASNDYLGFAFHPALRDAAAAAVQAFGAGSGAARLLGGSLAPHHELESGLAQFKGTEAALAFASGYAAALGTVPALVGPGDVVIVDKLVHACLVDAARLSGAQLRVFPHNDLGRLERLLQWAERQEGPPQAGEPPRRPHVLVITESVFSMDGDRAPLREMAELKDRFGAWLMVDEAHATGLYGTHRRGGAEAAGVADRIEVHMGTLGKALGAAGGFIAGSQILIDYLLNKARSFIFSTAPVPAAAAAALAGLRLLESPEGAQRCAALWASVHRLRGLLGWDSDSAPPPSAILPVVIGDETEAMRIAGELRERGLFVPAVRYPTVPRGTARLRITLSAAHTADEIGTLAAALKELGLPRPPAT